MSTISWEINIIYLLPLLVTEKKIITDVIWSYVKLLNVNKIVLCYLTYNFFFKIISQASTLLLKTKICSFNMIYKLFSNHSNFIYKHCSYVISGRKYDFTFIAEYTIYKKYKITPKFFFVYVVTPKSSILIIGDVRKTPLKRILSKGISYVYTR